MMGLHEKGWIGPEQAESVDNVLEFSEENEEACEVGAPEFRAFHKKICRFIRDSR